VPHFLHGDDGREFLRRRQELIGARPSFDVVLRLPSLLCGRRARVALKLALHDGAESLRESPMRAPKDEAREESSSSQFSLDEEPPLPANGQ